MVGFSARSQPRATTFERIIIDTLDTDIPQDDEATPKTNGHDDTSLTSEPPLKKRRVSEGTPSSITRKKPESPPWKKIAADGPSSFTEGGIRKSGRTNQIPLELQPPSDKRRTRAAIQKTSSSKPTTTNGRSSTISAGAQGSGPMANRSRKSGSFTKNESCQVSKSPAKAASSPKQVRRNSAAREASPTLVRTYKKKPLASENLDSTDTVQRATKTRRSARASELRSAQFATPNGKYAGDEPESPEQESKIKTPRIRFKVKPLCLPLVHPDNRLRKPKKYQTFEEFIEKAGDVPVEDGGLFSAEDDGQYTDNLALKDATLLLRMEDLAENGGILSPGVSTAYRPEDPDPAQRKLLKQYSHQDHLTRAVTEFRLLMLHEHKKHKQTAKRLADACRDEWYRRQPKTEEELEAETQKANEARYRSLMKTLQATWDNVKAEVNRRRLKEWEAEEQARVRKALNEAVDISTQKLEARRARPESELLSNDEEEDDDEGSDVRDEEGSEDDEESKISNGDSDSNMSSSESEADEDHNVQDVAGDENLTVEELKAKYDKLLESPDAMDIDGEESPEAEELQSEVGNPHNDGEDISDESDESVDMDDDLGSSDEDRDSEDDDDDDDDEGFEDNDNDGADSTLLGFLAPTDLAKLGFDKASPLPDVDDDILDEEDEVSLIPDASLIQTPDFVQMNETVESIKINELGEPSNAPATTESENAAALPRATDLLELTEPTKVAKAVEVSKLEEPLDVKLEPASADVEMTDAVPVEADASNLPTEADDHSSQPTPVTSDTRPSELDSVSSVEPHLSSRPATPDTTSQTTSKFKTPIPFLLRGTLREYQHYGLDWLAGLYANHTNGILADEMGLGKTIQTIALLAHLACEHQVWGPHLVIVPTSVMLNWEMEFKKWCPGFKILTYYGTQEERKRKRLGWKQVDQWNVIITSYQLVLQDQQVFRRRKWHYMILDEAHNIKNFRSQRWQTLLTFNTRARLLLTGTPLQNNLTELWSLLFFLMPSNGNEQGAFADLKEFSDWFRKPQEQILENGRETMDDEARAIISKLHKVLRPYLLRRMKADVEKQMPGKYEHVEYCRLSRRQRELYDGFLSRSGTRETLASGNYLSIINCLMQLRKVCNHPDLFQERPIMSSFPMKKSPIADFEIKDLLIRRKLLYQDPMCTASLSFLNLVPTKNEHLSGPINDRSNSLTAQRVLMDMREAQRLRAQYAFTSMDPSTVKSNLVYLESASRWSRFEELQHCVYLNALRRQQKPIYGNHLIELLDLGLNSRSSKKKPSKRIELLDWVQHSSTVLKDMILTLDQRSHAMDTTIQKFACITPPITTPDALPVILSPRGVEQFLSAPDRGRRDPFHEARMRLSVQFPDKRLLQYDCGKLQTLDKLLRKLQAGGHRALIFTQMTKVLDILEQFLNIHGHRYLRLDGATKIEQRQILTDRFNNDTRILAFILSSRSGGLGINLTGADTVIFYDLDWNPAMDKQCQDRCHRIGQTRDVHIYRLVSEHTIEANILRKANQKRMLDDVVIQEGEFTTDYFNKMTVKDVLGDEAALLDGDAAANAAMDRVLGGPTTTGEVQRVLEQAEDQEDVAAAKVAQQEIVQTDAADFDEKAITASATPKTPGPDTPVQDAITPRTNATPEPEFVVSTVNDGMEVDEDEVNAWGKLIKSMDDYMLIFMTAELADVPLELPKDKGKSKRGKDHRNRHRVR
jgi:helicase SWR1